ncbi:MAG TPA: glycosyltransferase family 1 protein [Roseiflexaceae bacterium]|nr:glycosyltransferase family 1 protein [Roseiflexaceae bacterium]
MQIGIDASRMSVAMRTGTEHYTFELVAALAQIDRQNRYTLYCNQLPAALPPLGSNFKLRRIPFPRLWTHARLSAEIALHAPDVLFIPAHVLPLGAPLRPKMRTVVTIHDMGYMRFPESHTPAQRRYLRLSTNWSVRAASHLIAISGATRDDLIRYAGARPEKISVVNHGVSPRFRPVEDQEAIAAVQAKYGITPPYFLYVGTIQPRKNLVRLLEAFATVGGWGMGDGSANSIAHPPSPIPQLVIAGKIGWLTREIERQTARLFGEGSAAVHFPGYVADDDLPALLSGALAFVFPSLYEGFGMPILEAMACGTPVLASATSALPEVAGGVSSGSGAGSGQAAALLVDPEDTAAIAHALARLASDAALRADLRARGIARAAQFTWERCAEETLAVLTGR